MGHDSSSTQGYFGQTRCRRRQASVKGNEKEGAWQRITRWSLCSIKNVHRQINRTDTSPHQRKGTEQDRDSGYRRATRNIASIPKTRRTDQLTTDPQTT